jgi:hypothetical protein
MVEADLNTEPRWLASRDLVLVKSNGERSDLCMRIGFPYEVSSGEWACATSLEGLHGRLHDIHGIDAWQSLALAQRLLMQLLGHALESGSTLLCHEPPEPVTLAELFPAVQASSPQ